MEARMRKVICRGKANLAKEKEKFFAVKRKIIAQKDEIERVERKERRK